MKDPETPPTKSTPESVERAIANIERGLEALDSRGEQGLQDFLDQLYPGTHRTMPEYPNPDVTQGLTGHSPTLVSPDEEAAVASAEHGPWEGEIPGTRVQLGHGMYAFDLGGDVPMHVVAGPPMPVVQYQPGMELDLSQPQGTSADEAPLVEEPAAPTSINSPGFAESAIKELQEHRAAVAWMKANPGRLPTAQIIRDEILRSESPSAGSLPTPNTPVTPAEEKPPATPTAEQQTQQQPQPPQSE